MLPFFRKIRWRLAQQNQFFKYSRYAVGEILLVVIGILIALQVNNWNEQRRNTKALKTNLISLLTEIEDNVVYLEWNIGRLEFDLRNIEDFIHILSVPNPSVVSDSLLMDGIRKISPKKFVTMRTYSYKTLIESGNIDFMKNDSLKEMIIGIEHALQNYEHFTNLWQEQWTNAFRPYIMKNGSLFFANDTIFEEPMPKSYFTIDPKSFVNNQEFLNILLMRASIDRRAKRQFSTMINRLQERGDAIQIYIESH